MVESVLMAVAFLAFLLVHDLVGVWAGSGLGPLAGRESGLRSEVWSQG